MEILEPPLVCDDGDEAKLNVVEVDEAERGGVEGAEVLCVVAALVLVEIGRGDSHLFYSRGGGT